MFSTVHSWQSSQVWKKTQNLYKANEKYFSYNYLEGRLHRKYLIIWQNSISIVWVDQSGLNKVHDKRSKETQLTAILTYFPIMPTFHNQNIR